MTMASATACHRLCTPQSSLAVVPGDRVVRSGRRPTRASARRSQRPPSSFEGVSPPICFSLWQEWAAASQENLYSVPYGCCSTRDQERGGARCEQGQPRRNRPHSAPVKRAYCAGADTSGESWRFGSGMEVSGRPLWLSYSQPIPAPAVPRNWRRRWVRFMMKEV